MGICFAHLTFTKILPASGNGHNLKKHFSKNRLYKKGSNTQ
jgi:hypothetical protein